MMMRTVFFLALAPCFAFGQTTWNGLTFGSTVADVRAILAKQDLQLEQTDKVWIVKPIWTLKVGKAALDFKPMLTFSQDHKLERISLRLQGGEIGEQRKDNAVFRSFAVPLIQDQLTAKYGTPGSATEGCKTPTSDLIGQHPIVDCTMTWKAESQIVKLEWIYEGERSTPDMLVWITYIGQISGGL